MTKRRTKRVLLIQPPYTYLRSEEEKKAYHPLGLGYIAAVLEHEGYEVGILDCAVEGWEIETGAGPDLIRVGLPPEEIERKILEFSPQVVGISNPYFTQAANAHEVAALSKAADKGIVVVMGGARPTAVPEEVLEDRCVDFVVLGEGEISMLELLTAVERGAGFDTLDGIAFRKNGEFCLRPKTAFIEDLDSIPFPARHLLPMEKYLAINAVHGSFRSTPVSPIVSSRGCPAKCVYCGIGKIWGCKFRSRSPENVIAEIEALTEKYGVKELHFQDDNLIFDKERALRLFSLMAEKRFDLIWSTPNGTAIWRLDEELLTQAKASGCYEMALAIESGDQEVLSHIIRKPVNLQKVKSLVGTMRRLDIRIVGFFILGLPGETKPQIEKTIGLADDLGLSAACFSIATPYPGTRLFEICEEKGYLVSGFDTNNLRFVKVNICTPEFSPQEIEQYYEKAMHVVDQIARRNRVGAIFRDRAALPGNIGKYLCRAVRHPGRVPVYAKSLLEVLRNRL